MHSTKPTRKRRNNLKNYFFFFLLLLIISSCGKQKPVGVHIDIPADSVISRNQMVKILSDIQVLEAALQEVRKKDTEKKEMAVFYYNQLFSKYHMSEKRFHSNLTNWLADPEVFYLLYEDVKKELDYRIRLQKPGKPKRK